MTLSNDLLNRLDKELHDDKVRTCSKCGFTGQGVHESPYYDRVLTRDNTDYFCDDSDACATRQEISRQKILFGLIHDWQKTEGR